MKLKQYTANIEYRGRSFDISLCAKSMKEVAKILNLPLHYARKYIGVVDIEKPYTEIWATPYSYNAVQLLGKKRMLFDEAKRLIDEEANKNIDQLWKHTS